MVTRFGRREKASAPGAFVSAVTLALPSGTDRDAGEPISDGTPARASDRGWR